MGDVFVTLSLFVLFFGCILIMITVGRKIFNVITIFEYERGLRYDKGKFTGMVNPGQYWIFALNSTIQKVDTRPNYITVGGQEVLTADGISVKISAAANYQITDPIVAAHQVEDYFQALYLMIQLSLRENIGSVSLDEVLEKRNLMSQQLMDNLTDQVKEIGLSLNSVNIKDITLNSELKKAYAQVVSAKKEGMANLEKARAESATLRNLANTAKLLENNPALLQLRMLQALDEKAGNTVVLNMTPDISVPEKTSL